MRAIFILIILGSVFLESKSNFSEGLNPKWLQHEGQFQNVKSSPEIDRFLNSMNGQFRPVLCWYTGTKLDSVKALGSGVLSTKSGKWTCSVNYSRIKSESQAFDVKINYRLMEGTCTSAGVAAIFDFSSWDITNYIMVPAMIYGGNRFRSLPLKYPPYIDRKEDKPLNMPVTVTDILHLNPDGSHALIEMNTGNIATPMLSFYNPGKKTGFILLTDQATKYGNNGLFVEEDAGSGTLKKHMSFVISAPGVREQRYVMCGRAPSRDDPADWIAGDEVTLHCMIFKFKAADLPAFYKKVFDVRKSLTGHNRYPNITPYSVAADLILDHFSKDKWYASGKFSYYSNNPASKSPFAYQIGWSGIPVYAFPNLLAETPDRLDRYCKSLDYLLDAQARTGLFYAMNRNGQKIGDNFRRMEELQSIALVRRSIDVLTFGIKSLDLMKKSKHENLIKPEWERMFRSCADGLVKVWEKYGQFGQFIDVETGEMDINGSTSVAGAGYALAQAYQYSGNPRYLEVAEASMRMYFERDLYNGYCGGGPAEILQAPDSESLQDIAESCIVLYEITGNKDWLEKAKYATNMLSTWMVSYDYSFPEGSAMEKAGIHAAGSVFASSQNNHSAPGWYIQSGDFLLKLFRATGDYRYAEMYKDQSHNVVQYIGAPYNPLPRKSGYMTERVQLSDWEGKNVGSNADDSNMAWETLGALTCLENPGIYLHTDDKTIIVMDHVEVEVVERGKVYLTLKITNPTRYDARIKIFAEPAARSRNPLLMNAFLNWPEISVGAGMSSEVKIRKTDGMIDRD
jgi:hypothetical protein